MLPGVDQGDESGVVTEAGVSVVWCDADRIMNKP